MLTQKQKLRLTSLSALLMQVVMLVCGFILPRLLLEFYGSAVNGLVSSITQFLWIVTLAECGVGAVVQSALYKPLAQKNLLELSRIIVAAEHFFRNLAKILVLYVVSLVVVYPNIINADYDFVFTASLIVIIAISSFAQYYFGITYRLLLNSDQFGFIPQIICIVALILNLGLSAILMYCGKSIHVVKLVSSAVFVMQPLAISFIAHRWYAIDFSTKFDAKAIPQKWNGFAQHAATVVLYSSGIGVLTFFSSLENVSVYSVYALVVNGVRNITMAITNGMQAFLGNLYAKGEVETLKKNFESFEWKMHTFVVLIFSVTAALIVPFVGVYANGVSDANYIDPFFGVTLVAAWGVFCVRYPYNVMVQVVGHYKQTQNSAVVETVLNVMIAIIFVCEFGLVGVAVGTLVAMIYRTFYLAWYVSKKIIDRPLRMFFKHVLVDVIVAILFACLLNFIGEGVLSYSEKFAPLSYIEWMIMAVKYGCIGVFVVGVVNVVFYREFTLGLFRRRSR